MVYFRALRVTAFEYTKNCKKTPIFSLKEGKRGNRGPNWGSYGLNSI